LFAHYSRKIQKQTLYAILDAHFPTVVIGDADFLSAFFFGMASTAGPLQPFFPAIPNRLIMFPTGMLPLFLVPYAIFFHGLSLLSYLKFQRRHRKEIA
jgi:hypothetical protein